MPVFRAGRRFTNVVSRRGGARVPVPVRHFWFATVATATVCDFGEPGTPRSMSFTAHNRSVVIRRQTARDPCLITFGFRPEGHFSGFPRLYPTQVGVTVLLRSPS